VATKMVSFAYHDPDNSVSLFDRDRKNEIGETYCVASAILPRQVDEEWDRYLAEEMERDCGGVHKGK
jgi:hypothetical protein